MPLDFILTGGQAPDIITAPELLKGHKPKGVIGDRAFDSDFLRNLIDKAKAKAVIPSIKARKRQIPHDKTTYKMRNRIERFFNKLKHFRRIATRYDRRAIYFLSALHLASAMIWMR